MLHTRLPCPSLSPGVFSNSCSLNWWCHPTTSSSVAHSSCPQSSPASCSFLVSQLFASCGQSTGVSASTSILPVNTQDWSLLGWTGWISLPSKGLSRVFSNTTVQKHQFFGAQLICNLLYVNYTSIKWGRGGRGGNGGEGQGEGETDIEITEWTSTKSSLVSFPHLLVGSICLACSEPHRKLSGADCVSGVGCGVGLWLSSNVHGWVVELFNLEWNVTKLFWL